jgi:DNA-binding transcriptional LysR family regulator
LPQSAPWRWRIRRQDLERALNARFTSGRQSVESGPPERVKLLRRSVRGVTPTEAGEAVYAQARLVLKQIDSTKAIAAQARKEPDGPVAVGLPWTIASVVGVGLLQEVRTALPAVRLELTEGQSSVLARMLAEGRLDVAVLFDNRSSTGLVMRPAVEEPLLLIGAAGSLPGRTSCSPEEAAELPLLLLSRQNGIRETLERTWAAMGCTPNVIAKVNSPSLLTEAVRSVLNTRSFLPVRWMSTCTGAHSMPSVV